MIEYRTHTCGELRTANAGQKVKLSGWIHRKRNLGNLCFVDLRDHYGITQCVVDSSSDLFKKLEDIRVESVITVDGEVVMRESVNKNMPTGDIEVKVSDVVLHSMADVLPIQVFGEDNSPEELRLKYRFLDLRREKIHNNIILRCKVIKRMRELMNEQGFLEYQTPILTASSPEGARDFLVPSRLNPGKFYALPQSPQQFKQLLMVSGFDKYYVDHTLGIWPMAAGGIPFNACEFQSKGDPLTDLYEDMAAEQKARSTYDNILRLCKDYPDVYEPIKFLRAREVVHFQRFGECLRLVTDKLSEKNFYAMNPDFDCSASCVKPVCKENEEKQM